MYILTNLIALSFDQGNFTDASLYLDHNNIETLEAGAFQGKYIKCKNILFNPWKAKRSNLVKGISAALS